MQLFTESDVRRLLPMREAIGLMREVFSALREGRAQNQPRRRLALPEGPVLHQMAGAFGGYFGTKVYSTSRQGAWFLFTLYSAEDGRPLALFEANWLGQIRTGAATGYATDVLARKDARTVGLIGSGFQAHGQLDAVMHIRRIERVRAWSRSEAARRLFAAEYDGRVEPAASAEEAVRDADIVITATSAREPVLDASWIAPGTHINAIGSNQANRRELPAELVRRADLIAVDSVEQARIESGDLLLALDEDQWKRVAELKDVSRRPREDAITIFKSNGLGVEDVAAAAHVYEKGTGRDLPLFYS